MSIRNCFYKRKNFRPSRQGGQAVLLFALIAFVVMAGLLLSRLDVDQMMRNERSKEQQILLRAKEAILTFALSRDHSTLPTALSRPPQLGTLLSADRTFDGNADNNCLNAISGTSTPNVQAQRRCIGLLPWKELSADSFSQQINNVGERDVWYALSANMLAHFCDPPPLPAPPLPALPSFNPSILNMSYTGSCGSGTSLPAPWLTVVDRSGNVLSNRVAAVFILPGPPLAGQMRPTAPASVTGTLLSAYMEGSNDDLSNIFTQGPSDNSFNDQLIYITIDEWMVMLEKRVLREMQQQLHRFYSFSAIAPASRYYPYAADLGSNSNVYTSIAGNLIGAPPLSSPGNTCANTTNSTCSANSGIAVFGTRNGRIFTGQSGSCQLVSTSLCVCNGLGTGTCSSNAQGGTGSNREVEPLIQSRYAQELANWRNYVIYQVSPDCTAATPGCSGINLLQVGSRTGVHALLLSAGRALSNTNCNGLTHNQNGSVRAIDSSRSSTVLCDYLDSNENTDGDLVYDAINTPLSNQYNDRSWIIAP